MMLLKKVLIVRFLKLFPSIFLYGFNTLVLEIRCLLENLAFVIILVIVSFCSVFGLSVLGLSVFGLSVFGLYSVCRYTPFSVYIPDGFRTFPFIDTSRRRRHSSIRRWTFSSEGEKNQLIKLYREHLSEISSIIFDQKGP